MFVVRLRNYVSDGTSETLANAIVEMVESLQELQRKDSVGEVLDGFDEARLESLRALDFEHLQLELVRNDEDELCLKLC